MANSVPQGRNHANAKRGMQQAGRVNERRGRSKDGRA